MVVDALVLSDTEDKTILLIGSSFSTLAHYAEQDSFSVHFADRIYNHCRFIDPLDSVVLVENKFYTRCFCLGGSRGLAP